MRHTFKHNWLYSSLAMILDEIFSINFQLVLMEHLTVIFGNTKINNWNALIEPNAIFFDFPSTTLYFGTRITQNGRGIREIWAKQDLTLNSVIRSFHCLLVFSHGTSYLCWNNEKCTFSKNAFEVLRYCISESIMYISIFIRCSCR